MTQSINEILTIASEHLESNRFDLAFTTARQALGMDSKNLQALQIAGEAATRAGQFGAALSMLNQAVSANPNDSKSHLLLSDAYARSGEVHEACRHAERSVALDPNSALAYAQLGRSRGIAWNPKGAVKALKTATTLDPDNAEIWESLGDVFSSIGEFEEASGAYLTAAQASGASPSSWAKRGHALRKLGALEESQASFVGASKAATPDIVSMIRLGKLYIDLGVLDEAEAVLSMVIESSPHDPEALSTLGVVHQQMGRFDLASEVFEEALRIQPTRAKTYLDLVSTKRISDADAELIDTMAQLVQSQAISFQEKRHVHYALGKAYDDLGDYRQATRYFDEANGIMDMMVTGTRLTKSILAARVDWMMGTFPNGRIEVANLPSSDIVPIFIVGMPRSGTTLVEQIITSHPEVAAGNEITYLQANWNRLVDPKLGTLSLGEMPEFASGYQQVLRGIANGQHYVTDKMPNNFQILGLLLSLFPNAKFIHCRRNPRDTMVSHFTTPFHAPLGIGHDFNTIATYYNEYLRLMQHWKTVLPSESFIEVDYESIVLDREIQIRKLVEFCGLDWNDRCLYPDQNTTPINTPSWWQARQPIYTRSMARWKNYEPYLPILMKVPDGHLDQ